MEKDIVIVGEPTGNPATCKFTVDRPVYPGGSAFFGNRAAAQHSPLARRVFDVPQIESLLIAENQVTVVLDVGMLREDPLNFHPMRNDRTTAVSAAGLLKFIHATGHEPLIAELPEIVKTP